MGDAKTIIHCCVDRGTYEMLMKHCEATGQTKTTAIKRAIKAYCSGEADAAGDSGNDGDGDT